MTAIQGFLDFLDESPVNFLAVSTVARHLEEAGFERVCGQEGYPDAKAMCNWGVADEELLGRLPKPEGSPWFTALLTLSSHEPWDVPMRRLADERCNAFAYTDSCLGAMLDRLERMPGWDRLLVVVVADHGVPVDGLSNDKMHLATRIPVLWTGGAVKEPRTVDVLMNQSDVAATLLAQLGLDVNDFTFSRNVLSPLYVDRFAVNAYKNGLYYIDSTGVTSYDCVSLSELDASYPSDARRSQRTQALLQLLYKTTGDLR